MDSGFFTRTSHWLSGSLCTVSPPPVSGSGLVGLSPQQVHIVKTINIGTLLGDHWASALGERNYRSTPSSWDGNRRFGPKAQVYGRQHSPPGVSSGCKCGIFQGLLAFSGALLMELRGCWDGRFRRAACCESCCNSCGGQQEEWVATSGPDVARYVSGVPKRTLDNTNLCLPSLAQVFWGLPSYPHVALFALHWF